MEFVLLLFLYTKAVSNKMRFMLIYTEMLFKI